MTTPILFKEYIWLVETIHKAGKITLAELNRRWLETESLHAEFSSNLRRIQGEFRLNSDDSRSLLQKDMKNRRLPIVALYGLYDSPYPINRDTSIVIDRPIGVYHDIDKNEEINRWVCLDKGTPTYRNRKYET